MTDSNIYATSDVARDIIQNSDYFTSVGKAVAEYVWNSIDYCKPRSRVEVHIDRRKGRLHTRRGRDVRYEGIVIEEKRNGGGLSRDDLRRFFTMHAETLARKEGRRVRGRFGTGKAAAFGIGRTLIIDTVKDSRRNIVRLNFENLKAGLEKVPVEALLTDRPDATVNRTTVIIDRLKLKRVKIESLRKFLQRSLRPHLRNHDILVEGEKLEYAQPQAEATWEFKCPADSTALLGEPVLKVSLAREELEQEDQGLAVSSNRYPIEIVDLDRGGSWMPRLFGEIDVPLLESGDPIPAFDNTRSRMNRDNPRVASLLKWIDRETTGIVRRLDREARSKLSEKEIAKLRETARDIEDVLNEDFSAMMSELDVQPPVGGAGQLPISSQVAESGVRALVLDEQGQATIAEAPSGDQNLLLSKGTGPTSATAAPNEPEHAALTPEGKPARATHATGRGRRPKGGFRISYVKEGREASRATFVPDRSEIRVNLDHPELALFRSIDDPLFKGFSGEVALAEYAMAAVMVKANYGHPELLESANAAIIELRTTINRLGRRFAPLLTRWLSGTLSPQ